MNDIERDVREAFDRLVSPAPPPPRAPDVLAAGRRARWRRSLLAVAGSAAGVGALLAAVTLLPSGGLPPAAAPGSPAVTVPSADPSVPGFTAAQLRAIARGCAESFGGAGVRLGTGTQMPDPSVPPQPAATLVDDPAAPLLADVIRVYAVVRDSAGTVALLYGPGVTLTCTVGGSSPYNAGGGIGSAGVPEWLPGPVSIDIRNGDPDGYLVAGRVAGTVARVTVVSGSRTATVPVTNGTYLGRVAAPAEDGFGVRAYDARGRLVAETGGTSVDDCYVTPDGTKISGDRTDPAQRCRPAVRWR